MKINVKSTTGKTITLEMAETDTVEDIKKKLTEFTKADVAAMKLIVSGKVLSDNTKAIIDCGIKDNDTVAVMIVKVSPHFSPSRASQSHPVRPFLLHPPPFPSPSPASAPTLYQSQSQSQSQPQSQPRPRPQSQI
jgi:hypothetical protein